MRDGLASNSRVDLRRERDVSRPSLHHLGSKALRFSDDLAVAITRLLGRLVLGPVVAFVGVAVLCGSPAEAHGRLGAAEGRCRLYIGPDVMDFTGYLPDASKAEFCEDIPATGHVIIALDAEQPELRDMAIAIRIVRDVGGSASDDEHLEAATVAYQPPKVYPTGTVNFEHVFNEAGFYVGIVTVTGPHGELWTSRFPFSVGMSFVRTLPVYFLFAIGVVAAFFIYLRHREIHPDLKKTEDAKDQPTPAE